MYAKIWLTGSILNLPLALASAPQIKLQAGVVHGAVCNGIDTSVYRGIPYAQPPVGDLRFRHPQPLNTSFPNEFLNATKFTATCIQAPGLFASTGPSTSEDWSARARRTISHSLLTCRSIQFDIDRICAFRQSFWFTRESLGTWRLQHRWLRLLPSL